MFDKDIIGLDNFLDLPMDAKALYFLLGMEADDEGFVSPKKVVRLYGGTEDSIKILIMKGFLIPFETGVVVITDWRRNNWLDKRRVKPTIYTDEKSKIIFNELTERYECLAEAKQVLREYRREENSIEENSIEENSIEEYIVEQSTTIPYKEIIDYLNSKANTNYKHTTQKTKDLIKARWNEKFSIDNFKKVIDNKCIEWLGTDMEKYLRPETLFGNKFESYLNQKPIRERKDKIMETLEGIYNGTIDS